MKYKTITKSISVKEVVKKSIFIGTVKSVGSQAAAKNFIKEMKEHFSDANHNAYAYRIGVLNEEFLYSDDGEPSKTAGFPIYNAIRSAGITNVVVIITRYFGGIKLGIHGLIQAYGGTAKFTIEKAGISEQAITKTFSITFPYNDLHFINYTVNKFECSIVERQFEATYVKLLLKIDEDRFKEFREILIASSHAIF